MHGTQHNPPPLLFISKPSNTMQTRCIACNTWHESTFHQYMDSLYLSSKRQRGRDERPENALACTPRTVRWLTCHPCATSTYNTHTTHTVAHLLHTHTHSYTSAATPIPPLSDAAAVRALCVREFPERTRDARKHKVQLTVCVCVFVCSSLCLHSVKWRARAGGMGGGCVVVGEDQHCSVAYGIRALYIC